MIEIEPNGDIDEVSITGPLNGEVTHAFCQKIMDVRKTGSRNLLWRGDGLTAIAPMETLLLERSFRLYRQLGGRIALIGFTRAHLDAIARTNWSRHINVFSNEDDAAHFLHRGNKTEIVPVIEPVQPEDDPETAEQPDEMADPAASGEAIPEEQPAETPLRYEDIFSDEKDTDAPRKENE